MFIVKIISRKICIIVKVLLHYYVCPKAKKAFVEYTGLG